MNTLKQSAITFTTIAERIVVENYFIVFAKRRPDF